MHSSSIIAFTLRVETPCTCISAGAATSAHLLNLSDATLLLGRTEHRSRFSSRLAPFSCRRLMAENRTYRYR